MGRHAGHRVVVAGGVLASAAAILAVSVIPVAVALARAILVPPLKRDEGTAVVSVDRAQGTITFRRTRDAVTDGRLSFWFDSGSGHARVGSIVSQAPGTVTRELLQVDSGDIDTAKRGRFNGWFYLHPTDLGFAVEDVEIATELGPAPAWLVKPDQELAVDSQRPWVVMVHGRAVKRAETIRGIPVFRKAGYTCLLVSYRNDFEAPSSRDGRYSLGDTEWRDVESAVAFAKLRGATSVVLMGWSMGGATALQMLTRSPLAATVVGLVLDSPVINWVDALDFQARAKRVPPVVSAIVYAMMGSRWGRPFTGLDSPINLRRLDFVSRAADLKIPTLILHSDSDGYIPSGPSRELARVRPDIVTLESFDTAGHTKLWNYDPERWNDAIERWLIKLSSSTASRS